MLEHSEEKLRITIINTFRIPSLLVSRVYNVTIIVVFRDISTRVAQWMNVLHNGWYIVNNISMHYMHWHFDWMMYRITWWGNCFDWMMDGVTWRGKDSTTEQGHHLHLTGSNYPPSQLCNFQIILSFPPVCYPYYIRQVYRYWPFSHSSCLISSQFLSHYY